MAASIGIAAIRDLPQGGTRTSKHAIQTIGSLEKKKRKQRICYSISLVGHKPPECRTVIYAGNYRGIVVVHTTSTTAGTVCRRIKARDGAYLSFSPGIAYRHDLIDGSGRYVFYTSTFSIRVSVVPRDNIRAFYSVHTVCM